VKTLRSSEFEQNHRRLVSDFDKAAEGL